MAMTRTRRETGWRLALVAVAMLATASVVTGRLAGGLSLVQGAVLLSLALAVALLAYRRIRGFSEERPAPLFEEAALGAMLVIGAYAVAEPAGGVRGPLQPLVYLV